MYLFSINGTNRNKSKIRFVGIERGKKIKKKKRIEEPDKGS